MSVTEPVQAVLRFDLTRNGQSPEMAMNCHLRDCRLLLVALDPYGYGSERAPVCSNPQIEDRVLNTLVDQAVVVVGVYFVGIELRRMLR